MVAATPLLRMTNITKRFGPVVANRSVTLEVSRGEVRGLLGENGAGKTTLMNILYGLVRPDSGDVRIDGRSVDVHSPRVATDLGIGMVHQHFMLVPNMTVAENFALGHADGSPLANLADVRERVRRLSRQYGFQVDPDERVEELSVGAQQRVEILKLLDRGAEIMIFDEPTAVLTPPEWDELATVMRSLAAEGKAIVLITHKLDELFRVADRCTVMRDGAVVDTVPMAATDKSALARMMVGRDVVLRAERPLVAPGKPVLECRGLDLVDAHGLHRLRDLTFAVAEGEVLGVAGVDGNGQRELLEVLIGMRTATVGEVYFNGERIDGLDPAEYTRRSGAVVPDDRRHTGLALELNILDNLMMKDIATPPYSHHGWINHAATRAHCADLVRDYGIRTPHLAVRMEQLSGGNQQKAVLARELHRNPRLLIASQPTRGLDVGAMETVYGLLAEHKRRGGATLLISTELDEVLSLSDRIAVMVNGRFVDVLDAADSDLETLGMLMAGAMERPA